VGRTMRTLIADERGLTLAEVLIAVAILGVGLVGLASVIPAASSAVQQGYQLSTATFLAEQMIERARAANWTATTPASDCLGVSAGDAAPVPTGVTCLTPQPTASTTSTQFPDEAAVTGYPAYRRAVRVTDCGATPCIAGMTHAGMRLVTVTVSYRGLTAAGASPTDSTVTLNWLVARK
jgi:prepilin-type N-terminal cleavage/methylation domain-containing protein